MQPTEFSVCVAFIYGLALLSYIVRTFCFENENKHANFLKKKKDSTLLPQGAGPTITNPYAGSFAGVGVNDSFSDCPILKAAKSDACVLIIRVRESARAIWGRLFMRS